MSTLTLSTETPHDFWSSNSLSPGAVVRPQGTAQLDSAAETVRLPGPLDKPDRDLEFLLAGRVQDAFQVLNYNQQLIQFADSKAGNLIVINSLFIAAAQAQGASAGLLRLGQASYILVACVAVLYCLSVITSKAEAAPPGRRDLIFFNDILSRRSGSQYSREFRDTALGVHLDDILRRTHTLALIAQRKFAAYATAQQLTGLAASLWVTANLVSLFR